MTEGDKHPFVSMFEAAGVEVVGIKEPGKDYIDLEKTRVMNICKRGEDTFAVDNNFKIYYLEDNEWKELEKVKNWKIEE